MSNLKTRVLSPLICLFAVCALALAEETRAPSAPFEFEQSQLEPDPAVTYGRLENGLRYAIMPNNQPKDTMSIRLYVPTGSFEEFEHERGWAHFLEHMAFNGSKNFPPGKLIEQLQDWGVAFGSHTNAHTSTDQTVYKLDLPDVRPETQKLAMLVMADWAGALELTEEEVRREEGIILAEMRDRDGPGLRMYRESVKVTYGADSTRATRSPIGVEETVKGATAEGLTEFYKRGYRAGDMFLVVVGAIEVESIQTIITDLFSGLPVAAPAPERDLGVPEADLNVVAIRPEPESPAVQVSITMVREEAKGADSAERRLAEDLGDFSCEIINRRIARLAKEDPDSPIMGGRFGNWPSYGLRHLSLSARSKPGREFDAHDLLVAELRRFLAHGPTKAEINVVKTATERSLRDAVTAKGSRENKGLVDAIWTSEHYDLVFRSPEQSLEFGLSQLENITAEALVQRLAYLANEPLRRVVMVQGSTTLVPADEDALRQRIDAAWSAEIAAAEEEKELAWAYGDRPQAGSDIVVERSELAHGIIALKGSNGVVVNLLKRDVKPNQVMLTASLMTPARSLAPGVAEFAGAALGGGGLGAHSSSDLALLSADTSARLGVASAGPEGIRFSGGSLSKDSERLFQLLRAWLTDAAWRENAALVAQRGWLQSMEAQQLDLDAQSNQQTMMMAGRGSLLFRGPTLDEARKVTLAQAQAAFTDVLASAPLEVAVVGDFDEQMIEALVRDYLFAGLPARTPVPQYSAITDLVGEGSTPPAGRAEVKVEAQVSRAIIKRLYPLPGPGDIHTRRRLSMLGRVVDELMRVEIRERLGAAYSPYAYYQGGSLERNQGFLLLNVGVAPDQVATTEKALDDLMGKLLETGVEAAVFDQVRNPTLAQLPTYLNDNGYWMGQVVTNAQTRPWRLEWSAGMLADYTAITAEELSTLLHEHIKPEAALTVVVVSEGGDADAPAPTK